MPVTFPISQPINEFNERYLKAKQAFLENGAPKSPAVSPFADLPLTMEGAQYNAGIGKKIVTMLFEGLIGGEPGSPEMLQSGAMNAFAMPIAYHGSPHVFDKFSTSKIGTGEGAQAYGHGLYFAENPSVAEGYRQSLSTNKVEKFIDGKPFDIHNPEHLAADEFASGWAQGKSRQQIHDDMIYRLGFGPEQNKARKIVLEGTPKNIEKKISQGGAAYKVDITPPIEKFLDWNKPLKEQSKEIQESVKKVFSNVKPVRFREGTYGATAVMPDGSGRVIWDINEATPKKAMESFSKWLDSSTGQNIYQRVTYGLDDTSQKKASQMLNDLGIPGVRYLDSGSRQSGGTYNYVVFNDKDVKILERN